MRENMKTPRCLSPAVAPPQSVPSWHVSAPDLEREIQALSAKLGRAPTEIEIAEELRIGLTDSWQTPDYLDAPEIGTLHDERSDESDEEGVPHLPTEPQKGPLFSRRTADMQDTPGSLPQAAAPGSSLTAWSISAPDIERAIQILSAEFGRAPSDIEITEELRIPLTAYREVLSYLKDLEIGVLYAERREEAGEEELVYLPNGSDDDALFRCLRSEMQELFRVAISDLPERERLVITFYYHERMDDKEICLILNLAESTVSNIRASAYLHIRASLASSVLGEKLRSLRSSQTRADSFEGNDNDTKIRDEEAAHVVVNGSQNGWLPKRRSWERFGERASLHRHFRSWYSLNEKQELTQLRRQEHYALKLEL